MNRLCCFILMVLCIGLAFFSCNSDECESSADCGPGQACTNGTCTNMDSDVDADGDIDIDVDMDVDGDSDGDTGTGFDPEFITVWKTDEAGMSNPDQIVLPLVENGVYDFVVDWGDGTQDTITSWDDKAVEHTYPKPGEYTVTIDGQLTGWAFIDYEAIKLIEISNWGEMALGDTAAQLYGAHLLKITAQDTPDLSQTTSLSWAFADCWAMTVIPNANNWDTSTITDMSNMFAHTDNFNQDISGWDTSAVVDMSFMFFESEVFDGDVSDWNTSSVLYMDHMFHAAYLFNGDLSDWDVSSVESMEQMFKRADIFNRDISSWDVSSVTNMRWMFFQAYSFNQNIGGWNVGNVTDMESLFYNSWVFNQDISEWDTSSVVTMLSMFEDAAEFDQDLGDWDITSVTDMSGMFNGVNLTTENYDALLMGWAGQSVQNSVTFSGGTSNYSATAAMAHATLTDTYDWIITDGGQI